MPSVMDGLEVLKHWYMGIAQKVLNKVTVLILTTSERRGRGKVRDPSALALQSKQQNLPNRNANCPNNPDIKFSSQCHLRELSLYNSYPLIPPYFYPSPHTSIQFKTPIQALQSKGQTHLCLVRQRHIRFLGKIDSRCDPQHFSIKNNVS